MSFFRSSAPAAKTAPDTNPKTKVLKLRLGYFEDYTSMPVVAGLEGVVRSATCRKLELPELISGLNNGEFEMALIPALEAIRTGAYQVVPCSCAAVLGPSRLFVLHSSKLPTEIRRVLVDKQDYGIVPIAKLLLQRKLMISPEFIASDKAMEPGGLDFGSCSDIDAFLVTGKNNLFIRQDAFSFSMDLTQTWYEYSKLPFVLHCWAVRKGLKLGPLEKELADVARRNENNREVAERAAERFGVAQSGVSAVYTRAFQTSFDAQVTQALRKLGQDLNQARIVPVRPISIYTTQTRTVPGA